MEGRRKGREGVCVLLEKKVKGRELHTERREGWTRGKDGDRVGLKWV